MEDNKMLVSRFYSELDKKNFGVYTALTTPDFQSHFPGSARPIDREQRERATRMFYAAFPDLQHTVEEVVAEGDRVAARLTARGTHRGEFRGVPATGRRIEFTGMRFYRIANGRIAEEWANLDMEGLLEQLRAP